jgi:predicted HD phosphohydrolase
MPSQSTSPRQITDNLIQLLEERGTGDYIGEGISQLEHSLQCANFGLKSGAVSPLCNPAPPTNNLPKEVTTKR